MQAFFLLPMYVSDMATSSHLRQLREAAGISQRELARLVGERHSNVQFWESSDVLPRSNVLIPMAKALGVTVEELLGEHKPRRVVTPGGKARQLFEAVSRLPRRQQEKIFDILQPFISQHGNGHKQVA